MQLEFVFFLLEETGSLFISGNLAQCTYLILVSLQDDNAGLKHI